MDRKQVEAWLAPAIEAGGDRLTMESVWQSIEAGQRQLWVGPKGAAVTEILQFPTCRVLHVLLAGGEIDQIRDFEDSAAAYGRAAGCTRMTLAGRRGWERALPHWKATEIVMERDIWADH